MMGYISLTGTEGAVFSDAKTLDPTCYDTAFVGEGVTPTPAPPISAPTPAPATSAPTPAPCADDDAQIIALASNAGYTISGCDFAKSFCEHVAYGSHVQATCPETCGLCCADDDAQIIALASNEGYTISGCDFAKSFCEHVAYGSLVQATCPETCDSCTRRLAGGKDPNDEELDWVEEMIAPQVDEPDQIDELTVVASPTPASAAGIRQKTEELVNPGTSLFYL